MNLIMVTSTTQWLTLDFGDGGVLQYGGASKGGRGVGLVADYIPAADSASLYINSYMLVLNLVLLEVLLVLTTYHIK